MIEELDNKTGVENEKLEQIKSNIEVETEYYQDLLEKNKEEEERKGCLDKDINSLQGQIKQLEITKEESETEIKKNESRILNITRRETRLNEMKDKLKELYRKAGIKIELD